MKPSSLATLLTDLLDKAIVEKVFPGAVAAISFGPPEKRENLILARGTTHTSPALSINKMSEKVFFDLASLTKPLATLLSLLCLIKSKKIQLVDHLPKLLKSNFFSPLADVTLEQLIGHCSGLPAHQPYFERLRNVPHEKRTNALHTWLLEEKQLYCPGSKTVYSDLGYMFLSWIIEKQTGRRLDEYYMQQVLAPLGLTEHLFFNPGNSTRKALYAPTENCLWRKKTLTGEVHDDNCHALGGVSGHAGLFGDIHGVLSLAVHLLDVYNEKSNHPNYNATDLQKMTKRQNIPENTWALGFDTPSLSGSSAGNNLSSKSFGHLGFTGTSFWIAPESDLVMVLLSNRVHPSRENKLIRSFRPRFHDTITGWLAMQKYVAK